MVDEEELVSPSVVRIIVRYDRHEGRVGAIRVDWLETNGTARERDNERRSTNLWRATARAYIRYSTLTTPLLF